MALEWTLALGHSKVSDGHRLISLPNEDSSRGISAIKRVEEITDARCWPYISALHLRQAQFAQSDHFDEISHGGVNFRHGYYPVVRDQFKVSLLSDEYNLRRL